MGSPMHCAVSPAQINLCSLMSVSSAFFLLTVSCISQPNPFAASHCVFSLCISTKILVSATYAMSPTTHHTQCRHRATCPSHYVSIFYLLTSPALHIRQHLHLNHNTRRAQQWAQPAPVSCTALCNEHISSSLVNLAPYPRERASLLSGTAGRTHLLCSQQILPAQGG